MKKIEFETILDNYNKAPQRAKEYFDEISQQEKDSKIIKCPNCNSVDVEYMGNDKKNFSAGKAVAGVALTGSVGSLAGFTGKKGNEKWHCKKCGYTFETKT
ncbi:hypothetical protein CBF29_07945 [Vagococcus elongatus]|uniref:Uncharacterized protein n=1 Tax=Vagococcus elongatus TaxID=180344 RepID=A0A430AU97_9ENTE|nr:hypothetical protein CBF29_07945 [Vagococcus elongatus]